MRLDLLLIRRHPGLSRRKARDVIEKGQVDVAGRTVTEAGSDVSGSAHLEWDPNRRARPRVRSSLPFLYADESLLIVDKPPGLLSVPTAPGADEDSVARRIQDHFRRLGTRRPYVGAVHRLDRDTSGALALALDAGTREALRDLFRRHRVERRYLALVAGSPRLDEGAIDLPIRDAYVAGRRGVARGGEPGRPACTRFRVRERLGHATLLEIELLTGRQHQIRIHLGHIGLPVVGDLVYGGRAAEALAAPRQMLHAAMLGFTHPKSALPVQAVSPLPADFESVLQALRRGAGAAAAPATGSRGRSGSR